MIKVFVALFATLTVCQAFCERYEVDRYPCDGYLIHCAHSWCDGVQDCQDAMDVRDCPDDRWYQGTDGAWVFRPTAEQLSTPADNRTCANFPEDLFLCDGELRLCNGIWCDRYNDCDDQADMMNCPPENAWFQDDNLDWHWNLDYADITSRPADAVSASPPDYLGSTLGPPSTWFTVCVAVSFVSSEFE